LIDSCISGASIAGGAMSAPSMMLAFGSLILVDSGGSAPVNSVLGWASVAGNLQQRMGIAHPQAQSTSVSPLKRETVSLQNALFGKKDLTR
jgi:hypothetical protein